MDRILVFNVSYDSKVFAFLFLFHHFAQRKNETKQSSEKKTRVDGRSFVVFFFLLALIEFFKANIAGIFTETLTANH